MICPKCDKTMVSNGTFVKTCDPPIYCDTYKCFGCGYKETQETRGETAEHRWHRINP